MALVQLIWAFLVKSESVREREVHEPVAGLHGLPVQCSPPWMGHEPAAAPQPTHEADDDG